MTQTIIPKDEAEWKRLRVEDVTSTDAAALFDCSPYLTCFELFHRKKDKLVVEFTPSERMSWGTRLQDAIAAGIAEDNKWTIRRMSEYMRLEKLRAGASFDFAIETDECGCGHKRGGHVYDEGMCRSGVACECKEFRGTTEGGLLEIKNVDSLAFKDGWIVEGDDIQAPPHIEIQVQHQLMVSGRKYAYIGALVGGNRLVLVKRDRDEAIIKAIRAKVVAFWKSIEAGQEPKPDFSKDAGFITKLYGYAEPGKVMDAKEDESMTYLVDRYKKLGEEKRASEAAQDEAKAEILRRIGDHEKVLGKNYTLSAGLVAEAEIKFTRKPYRSFKLSWKKNGKENA